MFKSKHWQSEVDGGWEKNRDDGGEGQLVLEPMVREMGESLGGGCVHRLEICSRDVCVIFLLATGHPVPSPRGVSSAVYLRPWQELQGKWEEI